MKKLIAAALAVLMMASPSFSTHVYAAEADVLGEWYLTSMQEGEEVYDASLLGMMGMTATMTLNEDGTAVLAMGEEGTDATWTMENGAGTLTMTEEEGTSEATMALVDGQIVINAEEGLTMTFGREMPEAATVDVGAVIANPELADFNGTWSGNTAFFFGMTLPLNMLGEEYSLTIEDGTIQYHHVGTSYEATEEETEEAAEGEEEPAQIVEDFTLQGELVDGALVVANGGDEGTVNLSLKLHENGYLTDGYTDPEEPETAAEGETEEESFDFRYYVIYEKAE